jgi:spermidine synthase
MNQRRVASVTTSFQKVEVWKSASQSEFRVAGAIHAWWHRSRFLTGLAWDNLAAACLLRPAGPPKSVLMLGLAGGTTFRILRQLLPDCQLTAVDIDGDIISLAREHMDLDALGIEVHTADAYQWLAKNKRRFDVVIDDIYLAGAGDVFRPAGPGTEHMPLVKRAMAPGGLLCMNLVTGKGHRAVQSQARKLFQSSFARVRSVQTPASLNETLTGGDDVLPPSSLGRWAECFADPFDRRLWRRIKVRKIA